MTEQDPRLELEGDTEELYEHAPSGYVSTTLDGTVIRANRTFLEWSGYEADEIVGKKRIYDLLTAGGRIYHETHYAPLLRMQGKVNEIAVDFRSSDGRKLPALINAYVRKGEGSEVVRVAVFDASDRREYERELLRARQRAEESEARARELAETLQASLIPPTPPRIPGLDLGTAFRPAGAGDEVGGDFFDIFELVDGDWAIVIGDVCGKGAKAATVTALARYTLRAGAMQARRPRKVLDLLNQAMELQTSDTFCTVGMARVKVNGDAGCTVTLSSAGHPLPIYLPLHSEPTTVGVPGTLMGVIGDPDLHDYEIVLSPGEVLVLYTDGATEARGEAGFFGAERLMSWLEQHRKDSAQEIADALQETLVTYQGGRPRDDIALVVMKVPERT